MSDKSAIMALQTTLRKVSSERDKLRRALGPFALISIEGVVKKGYGHVTITTCAEYFHEAREAMEPAE